MFALKRLMAALGSPNLDCRQDGAALRSGAGPRLLPLQPDHRRASRRPTRSCIVGANPRTEAAAPQRPHPQALAHGAACRSALIGEQVDLTYAYDYLGAGPETLAELAAGRARFAETLQGAERPLVIVGQGALARPDGAAILAAAARSPRRSARSTTAGTASACCTRRPSRVGALDLGFVPGEGGLDAPAMAAAGALDVLFNLGADEIEIAPGAFVIYQGTHGDRGAHRADVILPGAAYTEKSATYVNTEGRVQMANRAAFPPGDAREDWAILRALSDVLGQQLPFDSLPALRRALYAEHPHFAAVGEVDAGDAGRRSTALAGLGGAPSGRPSSTPVADFYLTNPIARASRGAWPSARRSQRGARPLQAAE